MNTIRLTRIAVLTIAVASLSACGITASVNRQLDAESAKLSSEPTTLKAAGKNMPEASITPQGDFLVADKPVALTPLQHAQMLFYRAQLVQVEQQAIVVAKQGVKAGMHGMFPVLVGALFGESDEAQERHMRKRLSGAFADAATNLCGRLPAVMVTEQQLASSLDAFRPYANLTPEKIDDCRSELLNGGDAERYGASARK